MSLLIKNGRIITAAKDYIADVFIDKEKITLIDTALNSTADRIIDAKNKYVIPGGVDVHTHLDMPLGEITSSDDFETGTRAAAFGGTTTIIDYATQTRETSMRAALDSWFKKAEGKAVIDYGFHIIITHLQSENSDEIGEMIKEGVTSFKLFMAYPNSLMVDDEIILKVMRRSAEFGGLVCIHAEDGLAIEKIVKKTLTEGKTIPIYHALTRPTTAERDAVVRAIELSQRANTPVYIVHVSSNDALEQIAIARGSGIKVFAETCPQYLFLSLDDMNVPGFDGAKFVLTPPLREKWNQEKLWDGLRKDTLQIVSTDHCPFNYKHQKEIGLNDFTKIPNGGPGIENRIHLIYQGGVNEGRISLNRWVKITSTAPAKMFGLFPRKGTIAVGSDADIIIWDPEKEHVISAKTHHMNVDYSLYEGMMIKGDADIVISRGDVIVEDGKFYGKPGRGNYLKRGTYV